MKRGLYVPNFGAFADAGAVARLAADAEAAGWDGLFVWDHVVRHEGDFPLAEPWVLLSAVAVATSTMAIGPLVTPLPRRRPWNVARAALTLDHLSGGRLVLGVGLGSSRGPEFSRFGEETDPRRRGDMLDEGVAVLRRIWTGEVVDHHGAHYEIDGIRFLPKPVRPEGIPMWAATEATSGRPVRRAAVLDGVFPIGIAPGDVGALLASVRDAGRSPRQPFDVVVTGTPTPEPWEGTGATWWLRLLPYDQPIGVSRSVVDAGPDGRPS
ncbi:LLM class flavin-dependent oxidoreductase [Acidiferrimicrobium sp. IK]|uniref:LLM class flavin-dependent oxidoreductase n=1 Tax=Acidiferrimicrobium sp. IK TaxID=2871700 RepID=UPI0021CB89E0|nr:LLM class flavin-dependent oxidoreductase [Acidiferrimicrobium sp. IK]MCU4187443.1 LLM class flavin-dependent oxidoreductase [Acidiferrimicrobium sp. IK]